MVPLHRAQARGSVRTSQLLGRENFSDSVSALRNPAPESQAERSFRTLHSPEITPGRNSLSHRQRAWQKQLFDEITWQASHSQPHPVTRGINRLWKSNQMLWAPPPTLAKAFCWGDLPGLRLKLGCHPFLLNFRRQWDSGCACSRCLPQCDDCCSLKRQLLNKLHA